MNDVRMTSTPSGLSFILIGLVALAPLAPADEPSQGGAGQPAATELIGPQTPWRVFLRMGPSVGRTEGTLVFGPTAKPADLSKPEILAGWTAGHTPSPADGWFRADFDDSGWGRYQADELGERIGRYESGFEGGARHAWLDRLSLRTCFGISDPAAAQDLTLELAYLGGVVVHVNGKEVGCSDMPAGLLDAAAFATDYPPDAYLTEDGTTFLPGLRPGMAPEPQ